MRRAAVIGLVLSTLLLAAWTHGGGGILLTDASGVLLTNANGDLLTR